MRKTHEAVKRQLREQWKQACNGYLVEMIRMWELDGHYGYWNSDKVGTIYHYGDTHNLTMDDIIFIVENDIAEDMVLAWEDYIVDASEFGFTIPNLPSWCSGCPRTPANVFERLRGLKRNLEEAVKDEKERIKKEM